MIVTWICYLLLLLFLAVALLSNIISLPGLWLMVLGTILYAILPGIQEPIGLHTVVATIVIAVVGEIAEFGASVIGAKSAGASRRAMIGALVGGLLGGIFSTFLIPIPIVGSLIGALAGCFIGAVISELTKNDDVIRSLRIGLGALKGRLLGLVAKIGLGIAILLIVLVKAFPGFHSKLPATAPLLPVPNVPAAAVPTSTNSIPPTTMP